jgi:hypothetical protein
MVLREVFLLIKLLFGCSALLLKILSLDDLIFLLAQTNVSLITNLFLKATLPELSIALKLRLTPKLETSIIEIQSVGYI